MISAPRKVACVEIGGIPISLSTRHERFLDLLLQRYEGFLSASPPEFALAFEIIDAGPISDEDVCVRRDGRRMAAGAWRFLGPLGSAHGNWAQCARMPILIPSIPCCAFCTA